jgi:hypothetical protein
VNDDFTGRAVVVQQLGTDTWGPPVAVGPRVGSDLMLVSCASAGHCVSSGYDAGGPLLTSLSGGRWTSHGLRIRRAPPLQTQNAACSTNGVCWVTGWTVVDGTSGSSTRSYVLGEVSGHWLPAIQVGAGVKLNGSPAQDMFFEQISCWSHSGCTLVGTAVNRATVGSFVQSVNRTGSSGDPVDWISHAAAA